MFAHLHGEYRHLHVVLPRGHYIYQVDVISLAELLPAVLPAIFLGVWTTGLFQDFLSGGGSFGIEVAESLDLSTFDVGKTLHRTGTSHTQADEAYAHDFHRLYGQSEYGLLSLYSGRYLEYDSSILNVIGNGTVIVSDRVAGCRHQH